MNHASQVIAGLPFANFYGYTSFTAMLQLKNLSFLIEQS